MTIPTLTYKPNVPGQHVDLDTLMAGGLLLQAQSGGGKSRAIRQLLEETHGRVQHIVIDPEGEFPSLREKFDYLHGAPRGGDFIATPKTARLVCRRLVELGASAVLDIYDLPLHEKREFVRLFLEELMSLPRSLWKPIIIVIDEADMFATQGAEASSTNAVIDLKGRGRKRGFQAVLTTRRLSRIHKDAADIPNRMIGRTGLDVDVKRAGDELGFDKDKRLTLPRLEPGQFYVYGPAISPVPQIVRTGDVKTSHPKAGRIGAVAPPPPAKVREFISQLADLPKEAEQEEKTVAELERQVKQLRGDLARAQKNGGGSIDPERMKQEIAAAVDRVRAGWTRDLRRTIAKELATLSSSIDKAKSFVSRLDPVVSDISLAFLSLDNQLSPNGELAPAISAPARQATVAHRSTLATSTPLVVSDGISTPQQRMLDALASFEAIGVNQLAKSHVAVYSDQSSRSSGFRANLSSLSAKGLIERVDSDTIRLSDGGRSLANATAAPASLEELHDAWRSKVSTPQRLMLSLLIGAHPNGIEKDDLARGSGQSPLSSGYRANLSTLSALGLVKRESGCIVASDLLYPKGLR